MVESLLTRAQEACRETSSNHVLQIRAGSTGAAQAVAANMSTDVWLMSAYALTANLRVGKAAAFLAALTVFLFFCKTPCHSQHDYDANMVLTDLMWYAHPCPSWPLRYAPAYCAQPPPVRDC